KSEWVIAALDQHERPLIRYAKWLLGDLEAARDVVQETFLRAYRKLDQFAGQAKFTTWLTKIAIHEARARVRRTSARRRLRGSLAPSGSNGGELDPEKRLLIGEMRTIMEAAIEALPDLYRPVFVLRQVQGLGTAETAGLLNLSGDVVKTRLKRARALLRKELRASVGPMGPEMFRFEGERCARMWAEKIFPVVRTFVPGRPRGR
ncbi:MAG TPA: sigma-70 family RNA polymerase sigma factor, partial [Thermoanaerobaculia bacterium]|nr:sigma-70 family RNA polymerase sigma factor [Thermoanaerobaculia bacterium]